MISLIRMICKETSSAAIIGIGNPTGTGMPVTCTAAGGLEVRRVHTGAGDPACGWIQEGQSTIPAARSSSMVASS